MRSTNPQSKTLPPAPPLDARQFMLAIKRLADSLSYGTDRSLFLGSGLEFAQSRPYQPGDPIKLIDWRVTARTGRLFIKEYETPKRMPVYLLVDTSASMVISSHRHSKYHVAVQIAGALALACLDRISPVGVLGVGSETLHVPPSLSKDTVLRWLHQLRHYREDERTLLGNRLTQLGPSLPNRVLMIVLSDMHDPSSLPVLKRLGQQHDCCVIQLRDPAERGLMGTGFFRAREAETGRSFIGHGRLPLDTGTDVQSSLRRAGIDHLALETDQPISIPLRQFFAARCLLGRGAR
ncbi:MAG: DUF58 domain-containing protein [Planctomycetota bacterium]